MDSRVDPGKALQGTLRRYQAGLQWLYLLTRLRLGACLADDMAERNPHRANFNTAVDIWGRVRATARDRRHEFPIPTALRNIIGDKKKGGGWSTYRTVAPLAAAVSVWAAGPEPDSWMDYDLELREFLALAAKLREFGVSHSAPLGRSGQTVAKTAPRP